MSPCLLICNGNSNFSAYEIDAGYAGGIGNCSNLRSASFYDSVSVICDIIWSLSYSCKGERKDLGYKNWAVEDLCQVGSR